MNSECLLKALKDMGLNNKFHVELLEKHYEMVIEKNKVMNLTSITDEKEFIIKHICDSLAPLLFLNIAGKKCIDVGTGAGFPGVPLKIATGSIEMDYAESVGKKANFVDQIINVLGLDGEVFVRRAEDMGRDELLREKYDIVFARAISRLNILTEYCTPLVKPGGMLVAYKGPHPEEEINKATKSFKILHCKMDNVYEYTLPSTDIKHTLVIIKKNAGTPKEYPRPTAKIKKHPL